MKVLHVSAGNLFGGVETMLATLARRRNLCPEMEPHFALCFAGRLRQELSAVGVPVHDLGPVRVSRPWTVWRARSRLRRLLQTVRFDRVICHACWPQAIFGPVVRAAGVPLVIWLHDAPDGRHWLQRWARWTPPDLAICNSRFTQGLLPRLYPGVASECVYCPVELNGEGARIVSRSQVRSQLDTPDDAVVIIQVSRMEAWKGHRLHLEALGGLRDMTNWVCWLVGGGQRSSEMAYMEELKRLAERLEMGDRVRFLGQRSDVPSLLRSADVFCQPNTGAEPFGIVFIEALAAGLPVVTAALGGALEIIDESCGTLVTVNDARAVTVALRRYLGEARRRSDHGEQGPQRAQRLCDPARRMRQLQEVLSSLSSLSSSVPCMSSP